MAEQLMIKWDIGVKSIMSTFDNIDHSVMIFMCGTGPVPNTEEKEFVDLAIRMHHKVLDSYFADENLVKFTEERRMRLPEQVGSDKLAPTGTPGMEGFAYVCFHRAVHYIRRCYTEGDVAVVLDANYKSASTDKDIPEHIDWKLKMYEAFDNSWRMGHNHPYLFKEPVRLGSMLNRKGTH